jgi:hypothetical protein
VDGNLDRSIQADATTRNEKPQGFWCLFITQQAAPQLPDG